MSMSKSEIQTSLTGAHSETESLNGTLENIKNDLEEWAGRQAQGGFEAAAAQMEEAKSKVESILELTYKALELIDEVNTGLNGG